MQKPGETTDPFVNAPIQPGVELPPMPTAEAGERFGPYRLIREIGAGGMGRVFLAERDDGVFEKQVALKFVRHDVGSETAIDRFVAERRMLARLDHPNIAALLDGGVSDGGVPYLVMEYVQGQSITQYCDAFRLTVRERVELFTAVCDAVQHAHQQLIIHRDLKPGNILVTDDGEVKLLDFGIAKLLAEDVAEGEVPLTRTGMMLMTPEYASPEQVQGHDLTTVSDVYALGIVLYELLTGQRPFHFDTRSIAEIERIVKEKAPRRPSTALTEVEGKGTGPGVGRLRGTDPHRLWRQLRGELDTVILKALRKEPERRYPTAAAFREDLDRYLKGLPVAAKTDSVTYRAKKFVSRHRLAVGAAAMIVLLLSSFVGIYTLSITNERDRVRAEADKTASVVTFLQQTFSAPRPEQDGRLVTVFDVMEEAEAVLAEEFAGQPDVEAAIRSTIAYTYQGLGLYERSQALVDSALVLLESDPDTDPARMAQAIGDIARLQDNRAVFDSAQTNYERAIALYREQAPEDGGLDDTLNDLATLFANTDRYAQAEEMYAETLERHRLRYGDGSPEVALILSNMSSSSLSLGQTERAGDLLAEAVSIYSSQPGYEMMLAVTINNLAYLRLQLDDRVGADTLFQRSLDLRRAVFGERHAEVGLGLHSLASQVLVPKGEFARAEAMLLEALDIFREAYPDGHIAPSVSLTTLGKIRLAEERWAEAEATLWQALRIQERILPDQHTFTSNTRSLLGEAIAAQGRYAEAEPLMIEGLSGLEAAQRGDLDTEISDARRRLDDLYQAWERPEPTGPRS